jgi:hypothetical protein
MPGIPSTATGKTSRAEHSEIVYLLARYAYLLTSLPCG